MSCLRECTPRAGRTNTDRLTCHRLRLLEENAHIGGTFLQPPADLRQLRYFVTIAEAGSLTAAAARLHVAQQSLSEQLRLVERRLGAQLLRRGPRGVTLTPVGEALLPEARATLAAADRAFEVATRAARGERDVLRVGVLSSIANHLLPVVVRRFSEHVPDVELRTEELPIAALVQRLHEGSLDAGLSRAPLVDDLRTEDLMREPVAAVLPLGHRLAGAESLALGDLAGEPWVLTARSTWPPWHRKYDRDFAAAGFEPRVVQRGTSPQNLLALVAAGIGVTRLPLSSRSLRDGGVVFVPLRDESIAIALVTNPAARSPALDSLRELLRSLSPEDVLG
jgi:DNA-binding transcriptional LysR family regulator